MNRLRDLREDADKTIAETAKIFHLQTTQYRRYEVGESDIPLRWAIKFAEHYGVTIDYLAGISNEPRQMKLKNYIEFSEKIIDTVNKYFGGKNNG